MKQQEFPISSNNEKLNLISSDIKKAQSLMRDQKILQRIRVFCEYRSILERDNPNDLNSYSGLEMHYNEYLVWDKIDDKSEWSIYYEKTEQSGYIDADGPIIFDRGMDGPEKRTMRKRLIETPLEIRLKMYNYLDKFIEEVCKKTKLDEFQSTKKNIEDALKRLQ